MPSRKLRGRASSATVQSAAIGLRAWAVSSAIPEGAANPAKVSRVPSEACVIPPSRRCCKLARCHLFDVRCGEPKS